MERLIKISEKRTKTVGTGFVRYLFHKIDWQQRLIIIKGARGAGKTTLLLQRLQELKGNGIYLSLDDFYFESNRMLLTIEHLYENGVRFFFLDEMHQYQHWSRDLKNLYDNYPDIHLIGTGSSMLQIEKGKADLSRRATIYHLYGLSFREFLEFENKTAFGEINLEEILQNHTYYSADINDKIDVLAAFKQYLEYGYYPFFKHNKLDYHQKLQQILQLTTEIDIPAIENINYSTMRSMKQLLYVLSQIVPFTPNIKKLADKIGVPRNSILKSLDLLQKGSLLNLLRAENQGVSYLQKPEKIYLENPNLAYIFSNGNPNKGNLRETFFFNQLNVKHSVTSSKFADFMVDQVYTFEVGGATKTSRQIAGIPQAFIVADDLENGTNNKIPLWLFGFLY